MPPEIVTALLVELDAGFDAGLADRLQEVAIRAGAVDVGAELTDRGDRLIWAEFHSVGDSTHATVEATRTVRAAAAGGRRGRPAPSVRMAVSTESHAIAAGGPRSSTSPCASATALLDAAAPGQILATEATVIVTGGGLPPGVDLVDRGSRNLAEGRPPERVYELRIDGVGGGTGQRAGSGRVGTGDHGTGVNRAGHGDHDDLPGVTETGRASIRSNLDWARRAVAGVDGTALDLDRVLDALADAWRSARGDGRRSVLLSGRGDTATRVAAEAAMRLDSGGALVLHGRWDRDVAAPYQGIREALGVYADGQGVEQLRADLEGRGHEIAGLLPDVAARIGVPGSSGVAGTGTGTGVAPDGATGDERSRLFDAVEAWISALARRRPTVLVIEDVHWAEPASLLLIDHLHHAGAGIALMVVATVGMEEEGGERASHRPTSSTGPELFAHADPDEIVRIDLDR